MILYTKYSRRGAEEYMSKLTSAISNLKKRLDKDEALLVQQENGYLEKVYVKLNAPATKKEIEHFPFKLPQDYEEFLRLHHGGRLFFTKDGGNNGIELYMIEQILEHRSYYADDFPENWYPVAMGYDGSFLIITDQHIEGGYLSWYETGNDFDDDISIGMTFEDWLEKLIIAQGSKFWEWDVRRPTGI